MESRAAGGDAAAAAGRGRDGADGDGADGAVADGAVADGTGADDRAVASAQEALEAFGPRFQAAYRDGLRRKIGLVDEHEGDIGR